jgi:hypothetical protein
MTVQQLYNKIENGHEFNAHLSWFSEINPAYKELIDHIKNNKLKSLLEIRNMLMREPHLIVYALMDVYPDAIETDGFIPLKTLCNVWLNILNNTDDVYYYKDYDKYQEYMNENYIPWNPFHEDDPNPTFEDFKNNILNKDK